MRSWNGAHVSVSGCATQVKHCRPITAKQHKDQRCSGGGNKETRPCRTGGTINRLLFFNLGGVEIAIKAFSFFFSKAARQEEKKHIRNLFFSQKSLFGWNFTQGKRLHANIYVLTSVSAFLFSLNNQQYRVAWGMRGGIHAASLM